MRLIDADKFKEDLMKLWDYSCVDDITSTTVLTQVLHDLDNVPTVEAYTTEQVKELVDLNKKLSEERPQGEWIDYNAYYKTCSICKRTVGIDFLIQKYEDKPEEYSFCPNCGASMKGGAEE